MSSKEANAPAAAVGRTLPGPRPGRRPHPWSHAGLAVVVLVAAAMSAPLARAGAFPVSQEQVLVGSTTGIAGVQAVDTLRETLTEANVAPNVTTDPAAQSVGPGAQISGSFPAGIHSVDRTYVEYQETTPGPGSNLSNPAATLPGCTWASCDSGRLSDNAYASSAAGGDLAVYGNFRLGVPPSSVVDRVYVGFEAFDPTGNDHLSVSLSWDGGTSWCPTIQSGGLPPADPNAYTFLNFTACTGHAWGPADFGPNLTARFVHTILGLADTIDLDANAVQVVVQPLAYRMSVQYNWSTVPSGQGYGLSVVGHISDEAVAVQVLTPPSTWSTRLTLNGTADQALSYGLTAAEYGSGNVSVRFVDALGPDSSASDLWLDLVDIVSVEHSYRLDVVQTVSGISGDGPTLVVQGNVSAGGENFDVFAWNFSAATWTLVLGAAFTTSDAPHSAALGADEVSNGTVRIDFRDQGTMDLVSSALTLDAISVVTMPAPAGPPDLLLPGAAVAVAAALAVVLFFVAMRRRRRSPETGSEAAPAIPPSSVAAEVSAAHAPSVDLDGLEPGHAYLIEEDEQEAALRALQHLTRMGRSGLMITRREPSEVRSMARLRHTKTVVLRDEHGVAGGTVTEANRDEVLSTVDDFLATNPVGVILLDGIGGLVDPKDFPSLLEFVRQVAAKVSRGRQILLASAADAFAGPELKLLAQELDVVRIVLEPNPPT